jgi:hypothetical protein
VTVLVLIALVVVAGLAIGGVAIMTSGGETDAALDRDELEISRGRELGRG